VFDDPDNCTNEVAGYRLAFPDDWWVNTKYEDPEAGHIAACRFFSPNEFDAYSITEPLGTPDGVAIAATFLRDGCFGSVNHVIHEEDRVWDGHQLTVREEAEGIQPGEAYAYSITINLGDSPCGSANSRQLQFRTSRALAGDYVENKEVLEAMMQTIQLVG
jgi:hypothetical protein